MFLPILFSLIISSVFSQVEKHIDLPRGCVSASKLVIFHINDEHGSFYSKQLSSTLFEGGLGRHMTFMEQEKKRILKSDKCSVFLFFNAGDLMTGDIRSDALDDRPDFEAMNIMGLTAMVLGNHDFDKGIDKIDSLIKNDAAFTVLGGNIFDLAEQKRPYNRYMVVSIGDTKIAVIGVTTQTTQKYKYVKDRYWFESPIDTVRELSPLLKNKFKADYIFVLSHVGGALHKSHNPMNVSSNSIAAFSDGNVDLVIDGHAHQVLQQPVEVESNDYPVLIVSAGYNTKYMGELVYDMQKGKRLNNMPRSYKLEPISSEKYKVHPKIAELEKKYSQMEKVRPYFKVIVDRNTVFFDGENDSVRKGATNLTRLMADSYRDCLSVDVAVLQSGSVRNSIYPGSVTLADIINTSPFMNKMYIVTLTGEQIKDLFTHDLRRQEEGIFRSGIQPKEMKKEKMYTFGSTDYFFDIVLKKKYSNKIKIASKLDYQCIEDFFEKNQTRLESEYKHP